MDVMQAVREHVSAGFKSPEIISVKTGIAIREVQVAIKTITSETPRSNVDILRQNLELLQQLLDTATWEYRAAPTVDNATAITSMINTSLSTIKEIESRKDPVELMNEVLAKVVQPLFRLFIKHVTSETSRARVELEDTFPSTQHPKIDDVVKGLVKNVGRLTSADYTDTVRSLAEVLGCKPEDEKVRMLRAVEDDDEQTGTDA